MEKFRKIKKSKLLFNTRSNTLYGTLAPTDFKATG